MLNQHRELFAQYWRWSDDWVQYALQKGVMWTAFGWTLPHRELPSSMSGRSATWPIQATGADISAHRLHPGNQTRHCAAGAGT